MLHPIPVLTLLLVIWQPQLRASSRPRAGGGPLLFGVPRQRGRSRAIQPWPGDKRPASRLGRVACLEAYLATCGRQEDRLKGLRYYLDRSTAVHDFEKRRVTGRGGEPTPEYLEALYSMHTAAQRLAEAENSPPALAESAKRGSQLRSRVSSKVCGC